MDYGFIKNITTNKWMLEPKTMAMLHPFIMGVFNGLEFDYKEPDVKRPIKVENYKHNYKGNDFINVQSIAGVIMKYDMNCGPYGILSVCKYMLECDKDENCIGHIMMMDSGGGSSDVIPEWENTINQLTKPVIGFINGMAASAAIYMLSFCDYVFAHHPSDEVGSVGVMCEFADFPKRAELEDGRILVRIYADSATEKNAAFEQALEGNVQLIKETSLNPINDRFISDMKKNRPGCQDNQLKGSLYLASNSIGSFIDEIGTMNQAVYKTIELSNRNYDDENQLIVNNTNQKIINMDTFPILAGLLEKDLKTDDNGNVMVDEQSIVKIESSLTLKDETLTANQELITSLNSELTSLKTEKEAQDATILEKDTEIAQLKDALKAATPKEATPPAEVNPIDTTGKSADPFSHLKDWYNNRKN